jgi:hypothetical protein
LRRGASRGNVAGFADARYSRVGWAVPPATGVEARDLVTVDYGESKPKDPNAPMDPANRRVQVVNMATKTAAK